MTTVPRSQGLDGATPPADHGDPEEEYRAAVEGAAVFDRSTRSILRVGGREPTRMLSGLASGALPPDPDPAPSGAVRGRVPYSLLLTPKGRVVSDLRIGRLEPGDSGALFLDLPPEGVEAARAHMAKYLPPRFAKVEPFEDPPGLLSVVGPEAPALLRETVFGPASPDLLELEEGEELVREDDSPLGGVRVIRTAEAVPAAFDVVATRDELRSLRDAWLEGGARPAGESVRTVLRVERGRPGFGADFDEGALPPEAGLDDRAIDHRKGCYTGQEVIVRIRDRGKVNRHLRGILLGDTAPPEPGTPVFHPGREAASGEVRTSVRSPAFGQTIALGYVRREVEPSERVRVGDPDGVEAEVRELTEGGWVDPE